ncbi:unnamed protein product [Urochloa humidicola]
MYRQISKNNKRSIMPLSYVTAVHTCPTPRKPHDPGRPPTHASNLKFESVRPPRHARKPARGDSPADRSFRLAGRPGSSTSKWTCDLQQAFSTCVDLLQASLQQASKFPHLRSPRNKHLLDLDV